MDKNNRSLDQNNSNEDVIKLMQEMIAIPSQYFHEDEIMNFTINWFKERGMDAKIHEYYEEKITGFKGKNVILELAGSKPGPTLLINGHLDTVKLCKGWTKDPYAGTVLGDNIYGVGALDMKSGCCAMMLATEKFQRIQKEFRGKIIVSLVSVEEGPYGMGTNSMIESGMLRDVDLSIITEPSAGFDFSTFPNICLGARGGYGLHVEFFGKSAHAALPQLGISAATDAAKFICELENIEYLKDDLLGQGVACVVAMESDGGACSVPDYSKVKLFWHIVVGEDEESIKAYIKDTMARANVKCDYKITFREFPTEGSRGFMPYKVDRNDDYVQRFFKSVKKVCGKEPDISYFQSIGDFNYLGSRINAPAIIFGAEGKNFHGPDEYATLSSIAKTSDVLYDFLVETLVK